MDKERLFLPDEVVVDMDPNMTNRLQQHTVVLDEGAQPGTSYSRVSPPKAVIDSSPLQSAMDKNKQSLIVKLSMRRPYDQLVQQGIMPSLKTSPAIYEQRRQLERAKTGDLLKAKIKKRPDRLELEQRHILEQCDSHVDPSLAEKRRMLEKALLVDHLNSKISHRPGPLDLIGKNILHVEEPIERMVKEGLVDYASTLDESNASVATPTTVGEGEDSLSSEGESLHSVTVAVPIKFHEYKGPPNAHRGSSSSSSSAGHGGGGGGGGSDNNYQLIMQQQYLLEYLEEMCKKPAGVSSPSSSREAPTTTTTNTDAEELAGSDQTPIDSPLGPGGSSSGVGGGAGSGSGSGRSKNSTSGGGGNGSGSSVGMGSSSTLPTTFAAMDIALDTLNRLKVSQLKKYCKQYNLAVSGTKSNLIERLKPYIKSIEPCAGGVPSTVGGVTAGCTAEAEIEDSLLAEQQKRIAELQLQLKKSQEELEQFRSLCNNPFAASDQPMVINAAVTIPPPPPPPPSSSSSSTQQPQLATVLGVGSPYSITTGGGGDSCDAPCTADGDASAGGTVSANQTPDRVSVPDSTVGAALEGSFFLEGLTPADSTTVDYGHDMHEMLPPELTSTLAPIERSPTHRPTLDKVLGQVQPTISGLTMKTEPTDELRNGGAGGGMSSVVGIGLGSAGAGAGGNGNVAGGVRAAVGDMHDLSLSMKSVNFEAVNGDTGDASMQQDTIMLNDFEDIDLVDFHMHSLDSDGPFPMITNHDPDPAGASRTATHAQPAAATMHDAIDAMFCNGGDDPNGKLLATNSFATNQPTGLLTNDAADSVLNANNCHRMMLDCAQDKPMYSFLPDPSILDYFSDDCNGHDFEIKHLEY
uniref:SAP domain-containing protein n=1 Tax=Anopheles merus TaxID=30066 RepID=A0A182ULX6_ANOME